jgi:hypothetical protein
MNLFKDIRTREHHLELAYRYLLSIFSTNVEAERIYSAADYIGNNTLCVAIHSFAFPKILTV